MNNKNNIEQQLVHLIENTYRLGTIHSHSGILFSMLSLSYEMIAIIDNLNKEEQNLVSFPLLFADYTQQECSANINFEYYSNQIKDLGSFITKITYPTPLQEISLCEFIQRENNLNETSFEQATKAPNSLANTNLPTCNDIIMRGGDRLNDILIYLTESINIHLGKILYQIKNPNFKRVLELEKTYIKKQPIWEELYFDFQTTKALETQDATKSEIRAFLKEYRVELNKKIKKLSFYGEIRNNIGHNANKLDITPVVANLHRAHDIINIHDYYFFIAITCLNDIISKEMRQNQEMGNEGNRTTHNHLNIYGDFNYYSGEKQEEEQKADSQNEYQEEEVLRNFIFSNTLFDTTNKLTLLRDEIASSIDFKEYNAIYGKPERKRIDPTKQNEWYYIFEAIQEAGICKKSIGDKDIINQMQEWFPTVFAYKNPEELKSNTDKLRKSISHERSIWKYGISREVTPLKEMWARHQQLGISAAKVSRFYDIAYKGLYMALIKLKASLQQMK